jgi:hypothetical protein
MKTRWREPAGLLLSRLDSGLRGHNGRALGVLVALSTNPQPRDAVARPRLCDSPEGGYYFIGVGQSEFAR